MQTSQSAPDKLWAMIKKHRFAMMTTRHEGGALRSRPMTTIDRDYDGSLWFFAKADSVVAAVLQEHPQVCLSYADAGDADFMCVAGSALIVTDVAKKTALWSPMVQAWFPQGAESADVVLVKVSPDHAEYWDSNSSKLVQLLSMAKSLATGKPPHDMGEHQNVPLSSPAAGARS